MSRYFAIQSWVSSHDNEPDYSGQQTGSRNVRSAEIPMFTQHGKANVDWFSDEAIAARSVVSKPTSKVPLKDRVIPQARRVRILTEQIIELETAYKAGEYTIKEYTQMRAILIGKRNRSQVLYERAINVSEPAYEDDDFYQEPPAQSYTSTQTVHCSVQNTPQNDVSAQDIPVWLSSINDENTFKNSLIRACHTYQSLVQLSHKLKRWHKAFSIEAKAFYRKWEGIER